MNYINYWITTHWPPLRGNDPDSIGAGVWLPDGREAAGNLLKPGDKVLIYQSLNGRPQVRTLYNGKKEIVYNIKGKEGYIAICEAVSNVYKKENVKPTKYIDGTKICWCWYAELRIISKSGFLKREQANEILGYSQNYNYRGFGDLHSGLKKITKKQYDKLVKLFLGKINTIKIPRKNLNNNSGESLSHFLLKHYVASNPEKVLSEKGLKTFKVEFPFPTGDRADILLVDIYGRIVGVEIEIDIDVFGYEGFIQAIKYRYMSEPMTKRKIGDSRAILIAYSISNNIKKYCNNYDVQYLEVNRKNVNKWVKSGEGLLIKKMFKSKT